MNSQGTTCEKTRKRYCLFNNEWASKDKCPPALHLFPPSEPSRFSGRAPIHHQRTSQHPSDTEKFYFPCAKAKGRSNSLYKDTEEIHGQAKKRICDFKRPKCISAHWPAHWNCAETLKFAHLTNWAEEQAQRTCLTFCSSHGRTREKWDTIRVKGTAADYPSSPQGYNLTIRIEHTNFSRSAIF